ncbi:MAG: hypothetical protein R3D29_15180 [Nitratireductor sp.]
MAHGSPDSDDDILSLVAGGAPRGRLLFAVITVVSGILLLLIRQQTEVGSQSGGWWNEPLNGPAFALSLIFVSSAIAAVVTPKTVRPGNHRGEAISLLLATAFLAAIWLIHIIGYGLAVLLFVAVCGVVAGFRGKRLVYTAFGMTLLMLLVFRIGLGLWFPTAMIFKAAPLLEPLGQYL